jgi:CubicO group peptidase (beta-lactamase class C family)
MTQPYAAGALYSTVEDLYKFDQALNTEQVLKSESKTRMFTPGLGEYGYGWQVRQRNGVITTGHEGGINGFHTLFNRSPELETLDCVLEQHRCRTLWLRWPSGSHGSRR